MSDDDKDRDPDFEPVYSTIELEDIKGGGSNISENFQLKIAANMATDTDVENTDIENDGQDKYKTKRTPYYKPRPKKDRRTSLIWTKFTLVDKEKQIAACNICDQRLSTKSTSGNLKKHLERKHGFSIQLGVINYKKKQYPKYLSPTPKPKVSELAGISEEGITVKVVGENGEEEHFQVLGEQYMSEEVVQEVQEHDYSSAERDASEQLNIGNVTSLNGTQASHSRREPQVYQSHRSYSHLDDKAKRIRIMELQMECLENKKYNMQLEALAMEQQLNLPRSIFTQPLRYADVSSRGTQTDVGGSDTRVFYITDKRGGRPIQQLFTVQDLDDY